MAEHRPVVVLIVEGDVPEGEGALRLFDGLRAGEVPDLRGDAENLQEPLKAGVAVLELLGEVDEGAHRVGEHIDVEQEGDQVGDLHPALGDADAAGDDDDDLNHGDTIGDIDTILAIENVDEIPEDTILGIYVKVVKKLRARLAKNAQIVCVSPYFYSSTTIRSDLITLREGIRKMCWSIGQRKGMRFIDGCNVGINPSNYGILCRDITHPMMEGQTLIASHIMEHITPPSIAAEQYDLPEVLDNGLKMVVTPYQPLVS